MKKGTNSSDMKNNNKKLLLNMIRKHEMSRAEIARESGLTKATITILVKQLMKEGLVSEECFNGYFGVGRAPLKLTLCKGAYYFLGITLYRKYYYIGLHDLAGDIIEHGYFEYQDESSDETLERMAETIREYTKHHEGVNVIGLGIASPGPVDSKNGIILNPPNFEKWHNVNIVERLKSMTGLTVYLENISNAYAICQKYFGVCKAPDDYAYILVDDGIGAGIVTNGKIYRGKNSNGSEIGHTSIMYNGRPCKCGNYGCLERYATIPAILEGTPYKSWAEAVDADCTDIIKQEAEYLSCAIVNLVNLFGLEKIVIGGDVAYKSEKLIQYMNDIINSRKIVKHKINIEAEKGEHNTAPAAIAVVLDELVF